MPESMMAVMCASKHCGRGLYPTPHWYVNKEPGPR